MTTRSCQGRYHDQGDGPWLHCPGCGAATCAVHAYLGAQGEWRCGGCFGEVDTATPPLSLRLRGRVPMPRTATAHVVIVLHGLHICGAARHCLELLAALTDRQIHTSVIALAGGGHWADRFLDHAHEVTILTAPSLDGRELTEVSWRAERRIVSTHYDPAIAWAVASPADAEYFAHFHTEPEFGLFTRAALMAAGARCRGVFFPSATTRSSYLRLLQGQAPSWWDTTGAVLPNATPASTVDVSTVAADVSATDVPRLAIVSRIDPDKMSLPLLVDTLDMLRAQLPAVRVRVAGDGVLRPQLAQALTRRGLDRHVELLGWVQDVAPVYAWAHATFLPSHRETMPYAAMESVRAGRPVVLPALGFFAQEQAPGSLVHPVAPGDPADAAAALRRVLAGGPAQEQNESRALFDPIAWRRLVLARYGLAPRQEGT